ncbi:MAG: hypothetical protein MUF68_04890 [Cyclobacteriaceae bacterium]|jgi:hypothetical protein|nr:hypothetical protein [Cyclobacteriaceae bacterium]
MKRFIHFFLLAILLSSCVVHHSGTISASTIAKPFSYSDVGIGVAQTTQPFNLGGNSQDGLVLEAKRELMKNYPLKKNEEYLNFTVDFKRTYYPILTKVKVTVTADIVAIETDTVFEKYSTQYKKRLKLGFENDLFEIGDTVTLGKNNIGVLVSVNKKNRARVQYQTKKNHTKTKSLNITNVYSKKDTYRGLKKNEWFIYSVNVNGEVKQTSAKIIAFGLNDFMVREASGNITTMKYKD